MDRGQLAVVAIWEWPVDVITALPGYTSIQLGFLLTEPWITPIFIEGNAFFNLHEVDDLVSLALCPWGQANDPVALLGVLPDFRFAARQRASTRRTGSAQTRYRA